MYYIAIAYIGSVLTQDQCPPSTCRASNHHHVSLSPQIISLLCIRRCVAQIFYVADARRSILNSPPCRPSTRTHTPTPTNHTDSQSAILAHIHTVYLLQAWTEFARTHTLRRTQFCVCDRCGLARVSVCAHICF